MPIPAVEKVEEGEENANVDEHENASVETLENEGESGLGEGAAVGEEKEIGDVEETGDETGKEDEQVTEEGGDVESLRAENKALAERLEKLEKVPAPAPVQFTDEQKAQIADRFGVEFKTVEQFNGLVANAVSMMEKRIGDRLGRFEKESAIAELAAKPGLENIRKYMSGINEFLKDYDVGVHSNPNLLEKAFYYAKGIGSGKETKKILNSKEINRKLLKKGVSHVVSKGKASGSSVRLTAEQKQAAADSGMSEEEYVKWMNPNISI